MSNKIILTPEEMKQQAEELLHILHNLRFHTKYWKQHFGGQAKQRKEYWEQKADEKLNQFGLNEHNNTKAIQIIRP